MKFQYQFEIVFIQLTLKRGLNIESTLSLKLLDQIKQSQPTYFPECDKTMKIKRVQKIINLEGLQSLKFKIEPDNKEIQNIFLQVQIQGAPRQNTEKIKIATEKMITQFDQSKKSIFQLLHEWGNAELSYKVYVSVKEVQNFTLSVNDLSVQPSIKYKRSNSLSRSKRPPELNISRKGIIANSRSRQSLVAKQNNEIIITKPKQENFQPLFKGLQDEDPTPLPKVVIFAEPSRFNKLYPQKQSPMSSFPETLSAWFKKKKAKQQKQYQNDQVKELLESHHPNLAEHEPVKQMSFKMKAVMGLLIIGLVFLLVDTLTDRSLKKFFKKKITESHHKAGPAKNGDGHHKKATNSKKGKEKH